MGYDVGIGRSGDDAMRVVVLSHQPQPVLDVLLTKLPGCDPVAVSRSEEVAGALAADAVVLLDLAVPAEGQSVARRLRDLGIRHGIVLIGTEDSDAVNGVVGLQPPFRLGDLATALQRARTHQLGLDVVVWSQHPERVLEVLRTKLPACAPVAVTSIDELVAALQEASVVLLDLGSPAEGLSVAWAVRDRGIRHGIVLIGTEDVDGLDGVIGLRPPFRLRDLAAAFERAQLHLPRSGSSGGQWTDRSSPPPPPQSWTARPLPPPTPAGQHWVPQREVVPDVAVEAAATVDAQLLTGRPPTPQSHPRAEGDSPPTVRATIDRWRKRLGGHPISKDSTPPAELYERLVSIFAATSKIESIAEDLPIVTDLSRLHQAIATSVAAELEADTVGVWRLTNQGWIPRAHHGFTRREARLPVPVDQPVMSRVDTAGGAILLDPVADFLALAAGIGGVHTNSFMAASMAVGPNRIGILTVGRNESFVEGDLDQLVELAVEAAVGIAVSEHIARMSSLVERMGGVQGRGEGREWAETEGMDEVAEAWRTAGEELGAQSRRADGKGHLERETDDEGDGEKDTVIDLTGRASQRS
jgi:hypothetical protein